MPVRLQTEVNAYHLTDKYLKSVGKTKEYNGTNGQGKARLGFGITDIDRAVSRAVLIEEGFTEKNTGGDQIAWPHIP
jgi:hypothetical protein